jgi:hypothetical protein
MKMIAFSSARGRLPDGVRERVAVVAFFATTATDGKTYKVEYFNLDAVLSVGYRVNSKRGTQFRIWATKLLRDHLLKGYTINERRLHGSSLFGWQKDEGLQGALGAVMQTFGGRDLYPSLEEKAAHLLYFLIKNNAFVDGNKRIGSASRFIPHR